MRQMIKVTCILLILGIFVLYKKQISGYSPHLHHNDGLQVKNRNFLGFMDAENASIPFVPDAQDDTDDNECYPNQVLHSPDPCLFVQQYCPGNSKIHYMELHYCYFEGKWTSYVVIVLLLTLYFYVVGQVTDRFFIPSLSRIAKYLNMSPNLAGVTLLSMGNGAPDIFATLEAVKNNSYQQAFGQVIGAASFISLGITSILSLTSLVSNFETARRPFLRDAGFLILGVCMALWLVHDHRIELWEPYLLVALYGVYVLTVVIGKLIYKRMKIYREEKKNNDRITREKIRLLNEIGFKGFPKKKDKNYEDVKLLVNEFNRDDMVSLAAETSEKKRNILRTNISESIDISFLRKVVTNFRKNLKSIQNRSSQSSVMTSLHAPQQEEEDSEPLMGLMTHSEEEALNDDLEQDKRFAQPKILDFESDLLLPTSWAERLDTFFEWSVKSNLGKIWLALSSPLLLLEHLTITWAEDHKYLRPLYVLHPPSITIFVFFVYDLWDTKIVINGENLGLWFYWFFPFSVVIAITVFLTSQNDHPPSYTPIFIGIGAIVSAMWIDLFANELVSCLGTLGRLFSISDAIMGLTIMAWGNSLSDLITDLLVSHRGFPEMATSAIYSSPITHVLIGLGVSFIVKTTQDGPIDLSTTGHTPDLTDTLFINFIFLLAGLLVTLMMVPLSNFRFTKPLGVVLLVIYLGSILLSILDLLGVIQLRMSLWSL